jgi:hypothetical protein
MFNIATMQTLDGATSIFTWYESLTEAERTQEVANVNLSLLGGFVAAAITFNAVAPGVFNRDMLIDLSMRYLRRYDNEIPRE